MTLGERIAARRKALGLSQNELARRASVNHPTLFKIESGQRRDPSISIVVRIARALGTSVEVLLGFEPEEKHEAVKPASAASKRRRSTADLERLATGGIALVEEMASLRRRIEALEAWRRNEEGRSRKRAAR